MAGRPPTFRPLQSEAIRTPPLLGTQGQARCDDAVVRGQASANTLGGQGAQCVRGGLRPEPIDLIPDFIPVIGYLDDALLLPALIWLAVRMLPRDVLDDWREKANRWIAENGRRPRSYIGAAAILALWLVLAVVAYRFVRS